MEGRTAIVVPVPGADAIVSEDDGMPPHITVLYPFLPAERITAGVLRRLRELCARMPVLDVEFRKTGHFPDAVYLEPEPDDGLKRLIASVAAEWPEAPPYGGRFEEVVPHLTIDPDAEPRDHLPLAALLNEACLYEFRDGLWRARRCFPFSTA